MTSNPDAEPAVASAEAKGNCWWCGKEVEDSWEHWKESDICEFGFMYGWWPHPLPPGGLFVGILPGNFPGYGLTVRSFS